MLHRRNLRRLIYTGAWRLRFFVRPPWRQVSTVLALTILVCVISWLSPAPVSVSGGGAVTISTDHPSETKPTAATYRSTATGIEPKTISLPTIKAEGFIQKVGVDQHQQIAVPTNIHLAGWFMGSAIPGKPGLSIIDGHLDGSHLPGIFSDLEKLKIDDRFEVGLANGGRLKYRVKAVRSLDVAQTADVLFSQMPGITSQLNLITCGGTFDKTAGIYKKRVVLMAEYLPAS